MRGTGNSRPIPWRTGLRDSSLGRHTTPPQELAPCEPLRVCGLPRLPRACPSAGLDEQWAQSSDRSMACQQTYRRLYAHITNDHFARARNDGSLSAMGPRTGITGLIRTGSGTRRAGAGLVRRFQEQSSNGIRSRRHGQTAVTRARVRDVRYRAGRKRRRNGCGRPRRTRGRGPATSHGRWRRDTARDRRR